MQNAFQLQLFNKGKVCFANRVGDEDKFFVVDLKANVVAYPVLVVEVKHIGVDGLDQSCALCRNCF